MILAVVFTALSPLVPAGRCAGIFPQEAIGPPGTEAYSFYKPTIPAIRYQIVSAFNVATICGTDSRDTDNTLVQIDIAAPSEGAREILVDQVIAALQTTSPPCNRQGYAETFDFPTKTYRALIEVEFNASTGSGSP